MPKTLVIEVCPRIDHDGRSSVNGLIFPFRSVDYRARSEWLGWVEPFGKSNQPFLSNVI